MNALREQRDRKKGVAEATEVAIVYKADRIAESK